MSRPIIERADALRPVLVASHPRSGTHLAIDLLRRQFRSFDNWRIWGFPLDHLYLNLERLGADNRRFPEILARKIINRPRRALMKTHFDADFVTGWSEDESIPPSQTWLDFLDQAHLLYVLRHPIDVMVSYHQFLSGIDERLSELDLMSFLRSSHWDGSANRLEWWNRHVVGWVERECVIVVRYEDIVRQTGKTLALVSNCLDEAPVGRDPLLPPKTISIRRTRFDRVLRLSPPSTAIVADRNRFRASEWRQSLTKSDVAWIEQQIGPSLIRFGYALDPEASVNPLLQ